MVKPLSAIESPSVRTTATPVATLLHPEDARLVSLDVAELEFVVVECVTHGVPTGNPIIATMALQCPVITSR